MCFVHCITKCTFWKMYWLNLLPYFSSSNLLRWNLTIRLLTPGNQQADNCLILLLWRKACHQELLPCNKLTWTSRYIHGAHFLGKPILLVYSRHYPFFHQLASRSHLVLTNPVNNLRSYFFKIYFNFTSHLRLAHWRGLFTSNSFCQFCMHIWNNNTTPLMF